MNQNCSTCRDWNRKFATDHKGEIVKGYVAGCLADFGMPEWVPAALKLVATNWDDGKDCQLYMPWDGEVKYREESSD